jgi:rare lipoprotein A
MMSRLGAALCGAALLLAFTPAANAQSGIASVYAPHGGRTADGERVSPGALTAAHRSLPFGTRVRVTNKRNGRSVVVRINDRGPFVRGRVIDLSPAAARAIGVSGLAPVEIDVVG